MVVMFSHVCACMYASMCVCVCSRVWCVHPATP